MAEIKNVERERFNETFNEWAQGDGRPAVTLLDGDLLKNIAGFFYFQGAADATTGAIITGGR